MRIAAAVFLMLVGLTIAKAEDALLAPATAKIVATDQLWIAVEFGNVGRLPATGFVAGEHIGMIERVPGESWSMTFKRDLLRDVCPKPQDGAGVIYPGGSREHTYSASLETFKPTLFIHGCFAYRSGAVEHHSEYCFIIDRGRTIRCPWGNDAR